MPEVVVSHVLGVDVMDADVHVETCLDVVGGNAAFLELLHGFSGSKDQRFVLWGYPTALNGCSFLLVGCFFLELAHHSSRNLHCFFRILVVGASSEINELFILAISWAIKIQFIVRHVVGVLLVWRSGRKWRTEAIVHIDDSFLLDFFDVGAIEHAMFLLIWPDLRVRVQFCAGHLRKILGERLLGQYGSC